MPKGTPRIASKKPRPQKLVLSDVERQAIERGVDELLALDMQWGLDDWERSILENIRKSLERSGTVSVRQEESLTRMAHRSRD